MLSSSSLVVMNATPVAALPKPASFRGRLSDDAGKLALELPGLPADAADPRFFPVSDTLIDHAAEQPFAAGATPMEAAVVANFAAGVEVGKLGAATVTPHEIVEAYDAHASEA